MSSYHKMDVFHSSMLNKECLVVVSDRARNPEKPKMLMSLRKLKKINFISCYFFKQTLSVSLWKREMRIFFSYRLEKWLNAFSSMVMECEGRRAMLIIMEDKMIKKIFKIEN
jgi:hypothetical protein